MKDVYNDGTYLAANPDWHTGDSAWKASHILDIMERNRIRPRTVCEVGCGAGETLSQLGDRLGAEVEFTGYEISQDAYQLCQARARKNIHFFCKDFFREKNEPPFELILAIDVFEHVRDFFGFLEQLRPRGKYKLFHIPLDLSAQMLIRRKPLMDKRQLKGHLHYFTRDTAIAALQDTGYRIIDSFYTGSSMSAPGLSAKASLFRMPRQFMFWLSPDLAVRTLGGYSLLVLTE